MGLVEEENDGDEERQKAYASLIKATPHLCKFRVEEWRVVSYIDYIAHKFLFKGKQERKMFD